MAKTKDHVAELKLLGDAELVERLAESRKELFNLRFQAATGQHPHRACGEGEMGEKNVARLVDDQRANGLANAQTGEIVVSQSRWWRCARRACCVCHGRDRRRRTEAHSRCVRAR